MSYLRRRGDIVDGILVPFAGPGDDKYATWWDARTDFALGMYAPHPLLYVHGVNDPRQHGVLRGFEVTSEGLYTEGVIRVSDSPIYGLLDAGRAAWSSATMPVVASPPRADGYIERWPIVEGSIADASIVAARRGLTAADYSRAVAEKQSYIRSVWGGWRMDGQDPQSKNGDSPGGELVGDPVGGQPGNQAGETPKAGDPPKSGDTGGDDKKSSETLTEEQEFAQWKAERDKAARRAEIEEVARAVLTGITQDESPKRKLPAKGEKSPVDLKDTIVRVASPWDHVGILGMAMHYESKAAFRGRNSDFSEEFDDKFFRAMAYKVADQWKDDEKVEQEFIPTPKGLLEVIPMRCIDLSSYRNWTRYIPHMRADEAMMSTLANKGDELVPTLLSSALYYFMRLESRVANLFRSFRMPSQPFDYPKITKGPVFVKADELSDAANFSVSNSNIDYSDIGTDDVQFSAGKLAAITLYSEELVEDSTVAWAEAAARVYVEEMAHAFDFVLLNGDTSASATNISFYGTDPSAATATKRILTFDGIRKGIVAADQLAVADIGDESILSVMALMGNRGVIGRDIRNLVCIAPPEVGYKLDALDAYEGIDKVGPQATLLTGQLGFWRSVPIIVTEEFPETDANGRVDDDATQNTKGAWIVANRTAVLIGMRRMPMLEQGREPGVDGRFITASLRADIELMEPGAAAMGFNSNV